MHLRTGAVALLVGLTWGCTNPFLRRGSLAVEAASSGGPQSPQPVANTKTRAWLSLGGAWAVNQVGSALFVLLLGQGADISMAVPVANGISIAANAVVDMLLGERYNVKLLLPGCVLVGAGVMLCTSA